MTKAKIVVAAKVGHQVVVRVQAVDAARVLAATLQPHAAFTKPALPRHAAHRVTRKARRPFVLAVQRRQERPARARAPSAPFHHARRATVPARANARLPREVIGQQGIARTASGPLVIDLTQPARHAKAQARDHRVIGPIVAVLKGIVQAIAAQEIAAQEAIGPIATVAASLRALKANHALPLCPRKTPASALRK